MSELQKAKSFREYLKCRLAKVEEFITGFDPQSQTKHDITTRIASVDNITSEFHTNNREILENDDPLNVEKNFDDAVTLEDRISGARGKLLGLLDIFEVERKPENKSTDYDRIATLMELQTELMKKFSLSQPTANHLPQAGKLPPLQFKKFSGKTEEYISFRDTFDSVISGHNLNEAAKFWYLTQNLSGEPLNLISSLEQQENCFTVAREFLEKRYSQKRLLVNNHLRALFNVPQMKDDSSACLRSLHGETTKQIRYLENQKVPIEHWDLILIHLVSAKLHPSTRAKIEEKMPVDELPDWKSFSKHIEERCEVLEATEQAKRTRLPAAPVKTEQAPKSVPRKSFAFPASFEEIANAEDKEMSTPSKEDTPKKSKEAKSSKFPKNSQRNLRRFECVFCQQAHLAHRCSKFLALEPQWRLEKVRSMKLCVNCLRDDHSSDTCSSTSCNHCGKRHHSTLHDSSFATNSDQVARTVQQTSEDNKKLAVTMCAKSVHSDIHVLLATAVVLVKDVNGKAVKCRTLLDSCSQPNVITQNVVDVLKLPLKKASFSIKGIGSSTTCTSRCVELEVQSRFSSYTIKVKCAVMSEIVDRLPPESIDLQKFKIPDDIELADPAFHIPSEVDMLIGAEFFYDLLGSQQIITSPTLPILQETKFGYIAAGKFADANYQNKFSGISLQTTYETLSRQVQRFWEVEDIDLPQRTLTKEEQSCEDFFAQTTRRDDDGRYVVKLPRKLPSSALGESLNMALACFRSLERRFASDSSLYEMYAAFMAEYESLGHMKPVPIGKHNNNGVCYIPHLPVLRPDSVSTKLRTVFNASAKTTSGKSLNDTLMVGPVIQSDLWSILIRFRLHRYVFVADITKMYRQVKVHPDDIDLQRILWRKHSSMPMQAYQLTTVTYGTSPASFLATRCLKQLTIDEGHKYPAAVSAIDDAYMDDIMTGTHFITDLLCKQHQLVQLLSSAGFELHKWAANHRAPIDAVEATETPISHPIQSDDSVKTLGLLWNTKDDHFLFKVKLSEKPISTKREILSDISKLFDPLGLVGPVIVAAKVIMRQLWAQKIDWDEPVPSNIEQRWNEYRLSLPTLDKCAIPRWLRYDPNEAFELHGFCDASEIAYGAVVYLRTIDHNGFMHSSIVCSKSRIAPIKPMTTPRLELSGALVLAQLVEKITKAINAKPCSIHLWTDSTIALSWIQTDVAKLKQYVGNRVETIQLLTKDYRWHHVDGRQNPADLVSRGSLPENLLSDPLWWKGPNWLTSVIDYSNDNFSLDASSEYVKEIRPLVSMVTVTSPCVVIHHYSVITQTIRVVAIWRRYFANLQALVAAKKQNKPPPELKKLDKTFLTSSEWDAAFMICIKLVQAECFKMELKDLRAVGKVNSSKSKLTSLVPFIDSNGLMRVRGRLLQSHLSDDEKNPIILPAKHSFVDALARHEHHKLCHAGPTLLLSSLRRRFWPLRGRDLCRRIVKQCVTCFRANPRPIIQTMGQLPMARVQQARPFIRSGVDFAGPVYIKSSKLRKAPILKAYISVFVCMSTKAIHLELVEDLSSPAFLAALSRFTSRRGKASEIFSDNGRNFVGADRELQEFYEWFDQDITQKTISSALLLQQIDWHYNPPYSPHRGGLWEAGVKSIKHHLRRTVGHHHLLFPEMYTLLCEIEAILNSRPLTPMSADPTELRALTPGDFLIGHELTAPAEPNLLPLPMNRLSRREFITQLKQLFWTRWQKEYLHTLQQVKNHWFQKPIEVKVGDLVVVEADKIPVGQWPLGRVCKLLPGKDNIVRTVDVRMADNNIINRAVQQLCLLPIDEDS